MGLIIGTLIAMIAIVAVTEVSAWYYYERVKAWDDRDKRHAAIAAIIAFDAMVIYKIILWSPAIQQP